MSSDFKEILTVSDEEIDLKLLQELVSYDEGYKIEKLPQRHEDAKNYKNDFNLGH